MLDRVKPATLSLLRPLTRTLIRGGIHPNALTGAGLVVSCATAWVYARGQLGWAATLLLLAGLFDVLDGAVARESGRVSRYGAFLDSSVDRYAEIVVFLGILLRFVGDAGTQIAVVLAVAGSLMVSYTKARSEGLGQEIRGGLLQRPERIVLLALGTYFGEVSLQVVLWLLAIFTNVTSVQRMVLVGAAMKKAAGKETVPSSAPEPSPGPAPRAGNL